MYLYRSMGQILCSVESGMLAYYLSNMMYGL